jgi:hypothetical protein
VLSEFSITTDGKGFQKICELLENLDDVAVNIERRDGLLIDWLISQDYAVHVTLPTIVSRRRPRRSKDDLGDAYLLAKLLRGRDRPRDGETTRTVSWSLLL